MDKKILVTQSSIPLFEEYTKEIKSIFETKWLTNMGEKHNELEEKLKKYLNEKKIPQHEKDKLVLLCSDSEVLWVAGIGLSDKIKVVDKPTHVIKLKEG